MKLDESCVGKKVRFNGWGTALRVEIVAIRGKHAIGFWDNGSAASFDYGDSDDWEFYVEPKKKVRKAPALMFYPNTVTDKEYISSAVYATESEARGHLGLMFIKWPANDNMWVEVEE